jgi:hypothetical protein
MSDYSNEMARFQKHLVNALPLMEGGEDITTLVLNIGIEYDQWLLDEIVDLSDDTRRALDHLFGESPADSLSIRRAS